MRKIFSILFGLVVVLFITMILFVFDIYPFNQTKKAPDNVLKNIGEELPDFLKEEKIGRAKTYTEYINRAKLLYEKGYISLAIAEYEGAAKLSPTNPQPLINIGDINYTLGDYIKAKVNYEEALQVEPENLTAKIGLGKTLIATRKLDESKKVFDSIEIHNQTSKYYHGILLAFAGDHQSAKNIFNEVINLGGDTKYASYSQDYLNAYKEFESYQGGSNIHQKTLLGRSYIKAKEYEIAIPLLFEVIKEKKDYRDAWILLGYAYLSTERYQDAIESLAEARKLDPEKAQTAFFLGLAYYNLNDYDNAVLMLQLAKKNGYEPRTHVDQKLAEIYLQMKKYEEAALSYENLLNQNSTDVNYFIKPIWIYIDKINKPDKAIAMASQAVKAHPDNAMSYNLLGWSYIGANQLMAAKTYLDKAKNMDPNLDAIYLNYGKLYEKKGEVNNAINYYKTAYELGKGNSIALAAADLYNQIINKSINEHAGFDPATMKADILNL
jgi:tetratricopeptide (TPR) repeat protein